MTGDQGEPDDLLEAIGAANVTGVQGELGDPLEAIEASTVLDVLDTAAASPLASLRAVPVVAPAVRLRSIAAKAKAKQLPAPPAAPTKVMKVSKAEVDAHLGVAVALLPGRIASAHVSLVVGELLHKLASAPMVGLPVHYELGEFFDSKSCRSSLAQCARVYLEMQADAHQTLLNSGDPVVAANPENFMAVGVCKWDETEQHMQLRASGMPSAIPLLRSYLDAKRRGESTQGMAMQALIQESFVYKVDLMNRRLATSETLVAPLKHLTEMTAAHLWTALTGPYPRTPFNSLVLLSRYLNLVIKF